MRGDIYLLPQYVFMVWCLDKHSDNFTFALYVNIIPLYGSYYYYYYYYYFIYVT
jgi:hypothetical protein